VEILVENRILHRWHAALIHLIISACIATSFFIYVLNTWYPSIFAEMSDVYGLFLILLLVDTALGPLLTLIAFNNKKSRTHLTADIICITSLQFIALFYGLYTIAICRPVILAAEPFALRVVSYNDVKIDEINHAPKNLQNLSWSGPRLVGVQTSKTSSEILDSIEWATRGYDIGTRPSRWVSFKQVKSSWILNSTPFSKIRLSEENSKILQLAAQEIKKPITELRAMPVLSKENGWFVVLDAASGKPLTFFKSK
jgi:hypothetical protein